MVLRIAVGVILPLISDATEEVVAVGVVLPLGANKDGVVLPELMPLVVGLGENIFFYFTVGMQTVLVCDQERKVE